MADITFEEIMRSIPKLTSEQKAALRRTLDSATLETSREQLIAEFAALRASGAFEHVESLRNRYAKPEHHDLTDNDLATTIHESANEWEQEFDEFFGDAP